jgi:hypothetical protein
MPHRAKRSAAVRDKTTNCKDRQHLAALAPFRPVPQSRPVGLVVAQRPVEGLPADPCSTGRSEPPSLPVISWA